MIEKVNLTWFSSGFWLGWGGPLILRCQASRIFFNGCRINCILSFKVAAAVITEISLIHEFIREFLETYIEVLSDELLILAGVTAPVAFDTLFVTGVVWPAPKKDQN